MHRLLVMPIRPDGAVLTPVMAGKYLERGCRLIQAWASGIEKEEIEGWLGTSGAYKDLDSQELSELGMILYKQSAVILVGAYGLHRAAKILIECLTSVEVHQRNYWTLLLQMMTLLNDKDGILRRLDEIRDMTPAATTAMILALRSGRIPLP